MFDDKIIKSGKRLTEIYAIAIAIILLSVSFFYSGISHLFYHNIFYKNLLNLGFPEGLFSKILIYFIAIYELVFSILILVPRIRKFSSIGLIIITGFYTILSASLLIKGFKIYSFFYGFKEPVCSKLLLKGVVYFLFSIYILTKSHKNG